MTYDIAIVMVCHNDLSAACLDSVQCAIDHAAARGLKAVLVVADNGSTAFAANECVDAHVRGAIALLRNGDFGYGNSCNRGAEEVDAAYSFFLNPDTVLHQEDILSRLHAFASAHPKFGILGPKVVYPDGSLQETCRRFPAWYMPVVQRTPVGSTPFGRRYTSRFLMRDYAHDKPRMVDWVQGSALFVPNALWRELGGFDHRYWMYFEDIDLCRRAWGKGRPVYYLPDVVIEHAYRKASAEKGNALRNIFTNRMARAHTASWLKYLRKWGLKPLS